MKALKAVLYFLQWVLYFCITMEDRNRYMSGKAKGMKCIDSYDSSRFVYGSTTTYVYDRTKKPERNYITWREFWKTRGYQNHKEITI